MKPEPVDAEDPGVMAVLSPPLERDAEAIARWYDKATILAGSPISLKDVLYSTARRRTLVLTDGTNQPVGLMSVALDDPGPGWATVALLAIAGPGQRDVAALAVAMLEAYLQGEARDIRASMPLEAGLALYFWLRLGYRPVASGGGLWMMRGLEA
jgi:hypothetical protein